jgi:dihydrofolate reductase
MPEMRQVIVVAVSRNGIIGRDGDMPWRLSTDLKRFKALTSGKPVIMGRKTFQSIGKPLPGRANIVVSRAADFAPELVTVANSLEQAITLAKALAVAAGVDEICIIGGGEIYRQAMLTADMLHVTHVEGDVEGDTSFPEINPAVWIAEQEIFVPAGERDSLATRFVTYRRR